MLKNKTTKLAVLSLLGVLGLTACGTTAADEIYAKPGNYKDPVVEVKDDEGNALDVHNNILSIIYDAIHEGSLSSEVLDKALYNFAESVFGVYNSLTKDAGSDEITLKGAMGDYDFATKQWKANTETVDAFIDAHKSYWVLDDDENRDTSDEAKAKERAAVLSKWQSIERRIAENMYSRALGGSYTEKNLFRERKYVKSLHESGEKVDYAGAMDADKTLPVFVPYTVEKQDVFGDGTAAKPAYLHRELYQSSASIASDEYDTVKSRFIEDKVIPEIYNDLLIEQYLLEQNVQSIRNTRARKINVIKIEKYSGFSDNADKLIKELVNEIYSSIPATTDEHLRYDADQIESDGRVLFEKYATISKGLYDEINADPAAKAVVQKLHDQASYIYEEETYSYGGQDYTYYKNTKYADLVDEFKKLSKTKIVDDVEVDKDWDEIDESLYSSYTSNGTTSIEEGFEQKYLGIKQQESITKGWYIQNKTASLDSNGTINDRLFKLSVANAKVEVAEGTEDFEENLEELEAYDRVVYNTDESKWELRDEWDDQNGFLCSINGAFYLKFEGQYAGEDRRNDIVYDDGNAYYVVQVLEASKDSKLRPTGDSSYSMSRGEDFLNETIDEVAKILGETGNYASTSKNYWLKQMDFKYHDQKVYDYFKDNYPDLFK